MLEKEARITESARYDVWVRSDVCDVSSLSIRLILGHHWEHDRAFRDILQLSLPGNLEPISTSLTVFWPKCSQFRVRFVVDAEWKHYFVIVNRHSSCRMAWELGDSCHLYRVSILEELSIYSLDCTFVCERVYHAMEVIGKKVEAIFRFKANIRQMVNRLHTITQKLYRERRSKSTRFWKQEIRLREADEARWRASVVDTRKVVTSKIFPAYLSDNANSVVNFRTI